jgi:tetratricopeptide (TPR) repeat protein
MHKSDYLRQKKLNPSDELRGILTSLEERQVKIKGMTSTQALILLRDLDQVYNLFEQLAATKVNLLPEQSRFGTLQARLKRNVGQLLKALGGSAALSEYRPKPAPDREQWWWYSHEIVAKEQQRFLSRTISIVIIALLLGGGVFLAFNTILAPSPETMAQVEAENEANQAVEETDYQTALAAIEAGLVKIPNDPGLLIYKGVLEQILKKEELAAESYAQAQNQLQETPLDFYLARSQLQLRLKQAELAESDARTVLNRDENIARAWLLLGQSLQLQGRDFQAISAYEKAGQVGLDNGDNEVVVLARLALGQIGVTP